MYRCCIRRIGRGQESNVVLLKMRQTDATFPVYQGWNVAEHRLKVNMYDPSHNMVLFQGGP